MRKIKISSWIRPTLLATCLVVSNQTSGCAYQSARSESLASEGREAEAIRNSKLGSGFCPYKSVQLARVVQAEDFANSGRSVAYADNDAGNNGGVYRSTEVDLLKMPTLTNSGNSNLISSAAKLAGDSQLGAADPASAPAQSPVPDSRPAAAAPGITSFSGDDGAIIYVDNLPYYVENANQPWSLNLVDSQTLRFELRPGDIWRNTNRTEIDGYLTMFPIDVVVDVYYDFLLEPGRTNTAAWFTIGDFHNDDRYTPGPMGIYLVNGDHMAVEIGSTSTLSDGLTNNFRYQNQNYGRAWIDPNPIQRDRYYAIHIRVKFNYNGNGFVNVWRDGIQIVSYQGSIGYNFGNGTYWKNGLYRAPAPETQAARYRNLVITQSP